MSEVRLEQTNGVLHIVIDRPPVNALSLSIQRELVGVFESVAERDDVSVVVLRGAGRGFCGGVDLASLQDRLNTDQRRERDELMFRVYTSLYEIPLPTICQMHGFTVGAGVVLSTLCDFRLMAANAFGLMPEIDRGTVAAGGAYLHRLQLRTADIRRLLLLGERVPADQALAMGLVDEVVAADDLDTRVWELAERLNRKSRLALRLSKQAALAAEAHADWRVGYRSTLSLNAQLRTSVAADEGVSAFLQKRPPTYEV